MQKIYSKELSQESLFNGYYVHANWEPTWVHMEKSASSWPLWHT